MPENEEQLEKKEKNIRWYVIHTYSGYENKVQDTLTRKVHSMGLEDTIKQILLPMQDEEEVKDGQKRSFPGKSSRATFSSRWKSMTTAGMSCGIRPA